MKLQVTQENLKNALSLVGRIAGSRTSLPVLSNVLLEVGENRLKVATTNLEVGVTYWMNGKIEKEGSITVPARLLADFVSTLPASNINLEVEENKLHIKTEHYESTINGIDAEEFPSIPQVAKEKPIELPGGVLKEAISQTVIAASSDEARPVLTGVYMFGDDTGLYMAATDSYRLAEKQVTDTRPAHDINLIIPARTMQELLRIIDDEQKTIRISADEGQILFQYEDVELVSRLIDGNFPDYRQLLPKESDVKAVLSKDNFLNITKVASLFAKENAGSITLRASEENSNVSIESVASQVGENESEAKAKVTGEGEVAINSRYIIDALNVIDNDEVSFEFSNEPKPTLLSSTEKENDYLHVIMPLQS